MGKESAKKMNKKPAKGKGKGASKIHKSRIKLTRNKTLRKAQPNGKIKI
jgi:hypothetical protein